MKRLYLLLTIVLAALTAQAYDFFAVNGDGVTIYYNNTSDGGCEVTYKDEQYNSYSGHVRIPTTVGGRNVTSIGYGAFFLCSSLESIEIPNTVTVIGIGAIRECTSLHSIKIPNSVSSIDNYAFVGCTSLESIEIPNSVTSIGDEAFVDCTMITSVEIPNSVTSMGDGVFGKCTSLSAFYGKYASEDNRCLIIDDVLTAFAGAGITSYKISDSVTSIGKRAFYGCTSLTSVEIPNSVISIGDGGFIDCTSLTSVVIPNSITYIEQNVFSGCNGLKSVEIPNSVTSIRAKAFYRCWSLRYIEIPSSVTYIGDQAFDVCYNLFTVINYSDLNIVERSNSYGRVGFFAHFILNKPDNIDGYLFKDGILAFYVGKETVLSLPEKYEGKDYNIGDRAFKENSDISSIMIPAGVRNIGTGAFLRCTSLATVFLPETVSSIGDAAFGGCTALTNIECRNATVAPVCGTDVFPASIYPTCVLYVPKEAMMRYYAREPWCNFQHIEDLTYSLVLNAEYLNLFVGEKFNLEASCIPEWMTPPSVTYSSSDSSVVTVNADGTVTATGEGAATITATAGDVSATCNVTVKILQLTDDATYTNDKDYDGVALNYIRNFDNNYWQPLYIPFNMSYEEWYDKAEVARINAVHQYDRNNDGDFDDVDVDETVIEFEVVKEGEVKPNIPYIIRPKQTGEVTFECEDKTLSAAPANDGSVWCSSTKYKYTLCGVYVTTEDMNGVYTMEDGIFRLNTTSVSALAPHRFYLAVEPVDNGYGAPTLPLSKPSMMKIIVNGSETAPTGVVGLVNTPADNVYYDLMGRRVATPSTGIYIVNGKKVIRK